MSLNQLTTIDVIKTFLEDTQAVAFSVATSKQERYKWVQQTLVKLRYYQLRKADKGVVTHYLMKVTGYSLAQTKRLIKKYRQTSTVKLKTAPRNGFKCRCKSCGIFFLCVWRLEIRFLFARDPGSGFAGSPGCRNLKLRSPAYASPQKRLARIQRVHLIHCQWVPPLIGCMPL